MDLPFIYKYQPLYLQDFEMDEKLLELIRILIQMDNLNILFIGDAGSGKSSLISAVLRDYYKDIDNNDNIMYINTLKEQGISYYRSEVKIFCQTACNIVGKKKILVLDDLDIINEQSQQVFRNFIDKYSHNVHFIASCNNTNKVIESIQSRINSIKIKALHESNLSKIMKRICKIENITITSEAEEFIISISNNSVRTMIIIWKNSNYWTAILISILLLMYVPIFLLKILKHTPIYVKQKKIISILLKYYIT